MNSLMQFNQSAVLLQPLFLVYTYTHYCSNV